MIELGKTQALTVVKNTDFGFYLGESQNTQDTVLLPKKYIPKDSSIGDSIEVFIYKDSSDRLISTTLKPKLELNQLAILRVVEVSSIGAFLDWGLEKDLLLPFKEQTERVVSNQEYLVSLYIDKSNRLCATMKVYDYLSNLSPYKKDDRVIGTVYEAKEEFGIFVAVDNKYYGLIPKNEIYKTYKMGDSIEARVQNVREDGKLDLSVREKIPMQMDVDAKLIYNKLLENNGILPFTDKTDPAVIQKEFNLSKNAFKRAIGRLLKEGKITLSDNSIKTEDSSTQ